MVAITQLLKLAGFVSAGVAILWLASACGCQPIASTVDAPHAPAMHLPNPDSGLGRFDSALVQQHAGNAAKHYHFDGRLDGQYRSANMMIHWRGLTGGGVKTLDVANALIARLQFEQTTQLQSSANAKALASLMQARTALEGRDTHMPDGTPIFD